MAPSSPSCWLSLLWVFAIQTTHAIDLFDINYPIIKTPPLRQSSNRAASSLFGYSLAFFTRQTSDQFQCPGWNPSTSSGDTATCHEILIGAPLDNQFAKHSGALYSCPINSLDCNWVHKDEIKEDLLQEVEVPQHGGKGFIAPNYSWSFEDAWFGISVKTPTLTSEHLTSSSSVEDFAVACSNQFAFLANPRLIKPSLPVIQNTSYYTGLCLRFDQDMNLVSDTQFERRFPCPMIVGENFNNVGCQTGFSADVNRMVEVGIQHSKQFLYGAPITGRHYSGVPIVQEEVTYDSMEGDPDFYLRSSLLYDRYKDEILGTTNSKGSYSVAFSSQHKPLVNNAQAASSFNFQATPMQYLSGAPMLAKGAVFVEQDSTPDENHEPKVLQKLYSDIIAQGFGRSVAAIDFNGDSFSEIIVGAPDYFEHKQHGGAVYGYTHDVASENSIFEAKPVFVFKGPPGSQFGHAVQNLGDINKDGCEDLAIGAPKQKNPDDSSDDNTGAVYIYLGSRDITFLKKKKPDQVLYAIQFSKHSKTGFIQNFGFSLSKARDLDNNGYEDLGIGAPGNGEKGIEGLVTVVRMRPLVHLTATLHAYQYSEDNKLVNLTYIDISSDSMQGCSRDETEDGKEIAGCFYMQVCFTLHPSPVPQSRTLSAINVDASVSLDSSFHSNFRRAVFASRMNNPAADELKLEQISIKDLSTPADTTKPICQPLEEIYIFRNTLSGGGGSGGQGDLGSKSSLPVLQSSSFEPITVSMNYSLSESQPSLSSTGSDNIRVGSPAETQLIDLYAFPTLNTSDALSLHQMDMAASMTAIVIQFAKECGKDQICFTRSHLDASFQEKVREELDEGSGILSNYVYLNEEFVISLKISIEEEPAYEPGVVIIFPSYIWFDSFHPECQYSTNSSLGQIRCTLANKVDGGNVILKNFTFMVRKTDAQFVNDEALKALFSITFVTISNITEDSDVRKNLSLTIYDEADVRLNGAGSPGTLIYGGVIRGAYSIKQGGDLRAIGEQVTHAYEVFNYGLVDIPKIIIDILWPEKLANGKFLFYVTDEPFVADSQNNRYPMSKYSCVKPDQLVDPLGISAIALADDATNGGGRNRRSSIPDSEPESEKMITQKSKMFLDCFDSKTKCSKISCAFKDLKSKAGVKISIRSRIWNATFMEDLPSSVEIASNAKVRITEADYLHQEQLSNDESKVISRVIKDPKLVKEKKIPIWIIILAVIGGLLLLLILIIICAKCGFFRRKRRQVNRANNYRPPASQTFQLGEMDMIDYPPMEVEPVRSPSTFKASGSVNLNNNGTRRGTGRSARPNNNEAAVPASSLRRPQNTNTSMNSQTPGSSNGYDGYWGDVSHI